MSQGKALLLIGQRFGKLVVVEKAATVNGRTFWGCVCDCGNKKAIRGTHLVSGRVISCRCQREKNNTDRLTTHGKSKTRIYRIWRDMINRCHYEKYPERHLYGGRGIVVCDRWRESFENFLSDMGECPPNRSIDRYPDKNGNYEPGNCRWATATEQARNRRKPAKRAEQAA